MVVRNESFKSVFSSAFWNRLNTKFCFRVSTRDGNFCKTSSLWRQFCQEPRFSGSLLSEGLQLKYWWKYRQNSGRCAFWLSVEGQNYRGTVEFDTKQFIRWMKICAKMVIKNLSQDEMDNRRKAFVDFLGWIENYLLFLERRTLRRILDFLLRPGSKTS